MTKETEVTVADEPVKVSSEREENVELEAVEEVVIDPPPAEEPTDIEDVIATQDDPRAEIYARQREKREKEIEEQTAGFEPESAESVVENDASGDIIEEPVPDTDTPPDSDEMVTVKILGDFREVPKAKVEAAGGIENYQIRIAAQEQMERNAHERRALEARQAALDERERQMAARQAEVPAMDPQQGNEDPDRSTQTDGLSLEEQGRRYQEALYDDSADAPAILANMVKQAAQTGQHFDEDAFRAKVRDDVLAEQRQAKIVKAGRALIEAHPELQHSDPQFDRRMYDMIDGETMIVERENPDWEPEQVVQEAYDRIQKWKGVPEKPETMSEKQAAKRAMTHPRTGTQRYTPPPPPPRKTNADYVAEERKRRGLE